MAAQKLGLYTVNYIHDECKLLVMNIINCVQTKFLSCHFLALGQFYAKSNHSMERSDILLYENHLSFVEILFTGPKFKGKEGYPIADQSTYWLM